MKRNYRKHFTIQYQIEKWWYEDSKTDIKRLLNNLGGIILCGLMFGALFILPAFFH